MTLDEVDRELGAWEERLRRMDDNLVALDNDPSFQLLSAAAKRDGIDGVTALRARPALDRVAELFASRERLGDVVTRARAVRATISALRPWDKDDKLATIGALLEGPSIDLGATETPLSHRDLLGEATQGLTATPAELLARMTAAFVEVRDVVTSIGRAWSALTPRLEAARAELLVLKGASARLEGLGEPAAAAEGALASAEACITRDPLGAARALEEVYAPKAALLRARVGEERAFGEAARGSLRHAEELFDSVSRRHRGAVTAAADASGAFAPEPETPPLDGPLIDGLGSWLEKLRHTVTLHRWGAAQVGLSRFCDAANEYLAHEERAEHEARALVAERDELTGRVAARHAQLESLRARGIAVETLVHRAAEAESVLRSRPCSLAAARALVIQLDAGIGLLARR